VDRSPGTLRKVLFGAARGENALDRVRADPRPSTLSMGQRRPETLAFLGFTHSCGWTRYRAFIVKRKTQRTRFIRKLKGLRILEKRRRHFPLAQQHRWPPSVLRGHYAYYGLPSNHPALHAFYEEVKRLWDRALRRRSQRGLTWSRFKRIPELFPLPEPRITQSREALARGLGQPSRGAECGKSARSDL